jgi:hypothetical protein
MWFPKKLLFNYVLAVSSQNKKLSVNAGGHLMCEYVNRREKFQLLSLKLIVSKVKKLLVFE